MNVGLILRTVRYIKVKQIYYQLINRLSKVKEYDGGQIASHPILFKRMNRSSDSFLGEDTFLFLNKSKSFEDINWNFSEYGKLWTYNLNYFDFLVQEKISKDQGVRLIDDYISKYDGLKDGKEPYPISLRSINWIKFFVKNNVRDENYDAILYRDLKRLYNRVENHLLGNHLLENAFALLFGSFYFQDSQMYEKAKSILIKELKEQTLSDGGHFELSPMYHCILFEKVLDCFQLVKSNGWKNHELEDFLKKVSGKMLGWLNQIIFEDKTFPLLNDSAYNISKTPSVLISYANQLWIEEEPVILTDSGYRKWKVANAELIMDIGSIGPDYIPGHAHADTFNFVLRVEGENIITDPGISTYEKNQQRNIERGTQLHNTVSFKGENSSEVWGGFRVGRRAKVRVIKDTQNLIEAVHNGYRYLKGVHTRSFKRENNSFEIIDRVNQIATAHFILGETCKLESVGENVFKLNSTILQFSGDIKSIEVETIKIPVGYNSYKNTKRINVLFTKELKSNFNFHENFISNR